VSQIDALDEFRAAGIKLHAWPDAALVALRQAWTEVIAEDTARDPLLAEAWQSYQRFSAAYTDWPARIRRLNASVRHASDPETSQNDLARRGIFKTVKGLCNGGYALLGPSRAGRVNEGGRVVCTPRMRKARRKQPSGPPPHVDKGTGAQNDWLVLFGETLETAFGIDAATLLVGTVCTH
jgi:hypothetical protein